MSKRPRHHQHCPWSPPHEPAAGERQVFGPACECDDLWARDLRFERAARPDSKSRADLAARLRSEDGPDADLEAFREAADAAMSREAAHESEVDLRRELAACQASMATLEEQLTQSRNAHDLAVEAFQGVSMKLGEARRAAADGERIARDSKRDYLRALDERDAARADLSLAQSEVTRLLTELVEWQESYRMMEARWRETGIRAVQEFVRSGATGDGWMTVEQVRQALDQADADHMAELEATRNDRDLAWEAFEGVNMKLEEARRLLAAAPRITDNGRGYPTYYLWEGKTRVQLVTLRVFTMQYGEVASALRRAEAELEARPLVQHWDCVGTHSLEHQCERCVELMRVELTRLEELRDAALTEPANGTIVVDAAHIAWQRRDADRDSRRGALCWFEVGSEESRDWSAVAAAGSVRVLWTTSKPIEHDG